MWKMSLSTTIDIQLNLKCCKDYWEEDNDCIVFCFFSYLREKKQPQNMQYEQYVLSCIVL